MLIIHYSGSGEEVEKLQNLLRNEQMESWAPDKMWYICTCNWFAALQKLPEKSLSIAECLPQLSMLITKLLKILTENSLLMAQCVRFRNPLKTSPNAPSPILYSSLKPFVAWLSSLVVKLWVPTRATATSMSHPPSLASEE